MSAVVAERELDYFGAEGRQAGVVQLFAPEPDDGCWHCDYRIAWPGYERTFGILGEDCWQALHLAMHVVPSAIFATDDFKSGRIGVWGGKLNSYEEICRLFDVKPVEGPAT